MEVSRLEISEELRTYGSCQRKVLEWMLEHPKMLRNTNGMKLTRAIGLADGIRMTEKQIEQAITRMFKQEILFKRGARSRYDIFFNFQHHRFPEDLIEKYADNIEHDGPVATVGGENEPSLPMRVIHFLEQYPESGKNTTARQLALDIKALEPEAGLKPTSLEATISSMARRGRITKVNKGVVNRTVIYDFGLPEEQETTAEKTTVDVNKEIREEIAESGAPGTEEPTAETVCPEPITVKADGGEIKLSITLNINITR